MMNEINKVLIRDQMRKDAEAIFGEQAVREAEAKAANWNGEAFPPVGWHGTCTWGQRTHWFECVVLPEKALAIKKYGQWITMEDGLLKNLEFQEKACPVDREREELKAIIARSDSYGHDYTTDAIIDAGWAKVVPSLETGKPPLESQREKVYVCAMAYRFLPDSEKASMEWQAHAERILRHLYDAGMLHKAPDLIRKAD